VGRVGDTQVPAGAHAAWRLSRELGLPCAVQVSAGCGLEPAIQANVLQVCLWPPS